MKRDLIAGLRVMPGVESVAETFLVPLDGSNSASVVWLDGASRAEGRQLSFNRVSRGYFETLGMRLIAGRDIADTDTASTPFVAVVNETFARMLLPGQGPIGRRFRVEASSTTPERLYEIVGLVGDAKYRRFRDAARPVIFVPILQRGGNVAGGTYLVRTSTALQGFTPAVRDTLARVDPRLRFIVRGLEAEIRDRPPARPRDGAALVAVRRPGRAARGGGPARRRRLRDRAPPPRDRHPPRAGRRPAAHRGVGAARERPPDRRRARRRHGRWRWS